MRRALVRRGVSCISVTVATNAHLPTVLILASDFSQILPHAENPNQARLQKGTVAMLALVPSISGRSNLKMSKALKILNLGVLTGQFPIVAITLLLAFDLVHPEHIVFGKKKILASKSISINRALYEGRLLGYRARFVYEEATVVSKAVLTVVDSVENATTRGQKSLSRATPLGAKCPTS